MNLLANLLSKKKPDGQILITLVIVIPALILMVAAYLTLSVSGYRLSRQGQFHTQAQLAADGAADYAIEQINQDASWPGTASETTLHSDSSEKTTYSVSVTNNSSISKTLTSTGRTYWPANSPTAKSYVTVKVDLRAVSAGSYSVVSGEGGLYMDNNSKIAGGDVYVNGEINLSNSAQIGLTTNPLTVNVADQVCPNPPDASYPRICNSGESAQPISISNTGHIYGTVRANNQTSSTGMSNPGLVSSSGVTTQSLPTYDRNAQKAAIITTTTGTLASCSSGQRTWLANSKITGNVTVSGRCKVTVQGNIWITGTLSIKNSGQLIVDNSLANTRPYIMIDGAGGASFINNSNLVSNASSTGFEIITFWSNASCSPDCTSVTGVDLYNSRNIVTITLDNSAQGAESIFYSYWSRILLKNNGQIGAIIGQSVQLQNAGTITFKSSSGVGSTFWVSNGYRRSFQ